MKKFFMDNILKDLENGRPNDKEHTLLVVDYVKKIIKNSPNLELDQDVLEIASFAHDWGYAGLVDPDIAVRLEHLGALKETHMKIGAEKLAKLLEDSYFDYLTPEQKERTVHLVSVHDKLDSLKNTEEIILMEADSLGGMEPEVMGVFSDTASEERYMRKSREFRLSRFITDYSKEEFERLFQKRKSFFEKVNNRNV